MLLLLIVLPFLDVAQLADDSFIIREEANLRLSKAGITSVPALYYGANHRDLEVKHRSQKLLKPYLTNTFFIPIWLKH